MNDFYLMTFSELIGLFQGLELAAMLRMSLRWVPYLFTTAGGLIILVTSFRHDWSNLTRYLSLFLYAFWSLLLIGLFWPEAPPFHRLGTVAVAPSQLISYPASQDALVQTVTAEDTGQVNTTPVVMPKPFMTILGALIDTPLGIARRLNPLAHQSFRRMQSLSWYLGLDLPADVSRALEDWIQGCFKPVMTTDQEFQESITSRDLLPWGDTPIARALATRETVPGASTSGRYLRTNRPLGLFFLANPDSPKAVRCDVYLQAVQMDVQRWLFETKSPAGVPLSQVFQEDFQRDVGQQAQWLVLREMTKLIGRPAPVPSLGGAYAGLTGAQAVGGAVGGAISGAVNPRSTSLVGGIVGLFGSVSGQFADIVRAITFAVGLAMVFIYSAPEIFGTALMVLVALFPVAVCYMLVPFAGFKPLFHYFLALLFVCASPLWFALIDLRMRSAMDTAPQSADPLMTLLNWAPAMVLGARAVVIGIPVVFAMGGAILFFSLRSAVQGLRSH